MSKDIRKNIDKAPPEHASREGATSFSGFQPSSLFANQGSTDDETSITKDQRLGLKHIDDTTSHQADAYDAARRDSTKG